VIRFGKCSKKKNKNFFLENDYFIIQKSLERYRGKKKDLKGKTLMKKLQR
jgi:hypothetical protein